MKTRDRRALVLLGIAVAGILIYRMNAGAPKVVALDETVPAAEMRLDRMRRIAATVPAKESVWKHAQAELATREKNLLHSNTAPEAQAQLLTTARRLATVEQIDLRSAEFGEPKAMGQHYGQVTAATTFECHIEQFVNFMAALARESDLIAPVEIRVMTGSAPKTVGVRMVLAGVVPRKLVPAKKGYGAF